MSSISRTALPPGKTNSVHIGHNRFAVVTQFAIQVSYETGIQVTPSQFVQHLVDNYGTIAIMNWAQTMYKEDKKV
jgi:hypothetical protein